MKNTKAYILVLCLVLLFCAMPWKKIAKAGRQPAAVSKSASADQDLSQLQSEKSWIRVTGILREGSVELNDGSSQPMYYIEAIRVTRLEKAGVNPISN